MCIIPAMRATAGRALHTSTSHHRHSCPRHPAACRPAPTPVTALTARHWRRPPHHRHRHHRHRGGGRTTRARCHGPGGDRRCQHWQGGWRRGHRAGRGRHWCVRREVPPTASGVPPAAGRHPHWHGHRQRLRYARHLHCHHAPRGPNGLLPAQPRPTAPTVHHATYHHDPHPHWHRCSQGPAYRSYSEASLAP